MVVAVLLNTPPLLGKVPVVKLLTAAGVPSVQLSTEKSVLPAIVLPVTYPTNEVVVVKADKQKSHSVVLPLIL